jgi:Domain of unknown function (DUF4124)
MKLGYRTEILIILATGFASAWISSAAATEVYTWTDQDGIVHYSDTPLSNAASQKIEVEGAYRPGTSGADPASTEPTAGAATSSQTPDGENPQSAAQQRREQIAENREERREAKAENDQLCAKHRQRLTQMEPARRVFYTNEKGESVRMDDDQRMELIKDDKEFIDKNCE